MDNYINYRKYIFLSIILCFALTSVSWSKNLNGRSAENFGLKAEQEIGLSAEKAISIRLSNDRTPEVKKKKFFQKLGHFFSQFINVAGFFPSKLFEYGVISVGWELLTDNFQENKIKSALIDGVLNEAALREQLAPGYNNCLLTSDDSAACFSYLEGLSLIADNFVKNNLAKIKIMNYDAMEELEKNAHYALVYAIAKKNIKEQGFSTKVTLSEKNKSQLVLSSLNVVNDYRQCLNLSENDEELADCDYKIGVSAPYRIGLEVFKLQLDKSISCEVTEAEYVELKKKAIAQFNICTEETYFLVLELDPK